MRFKIRFVIGNRLGAASIYSLVEFCVGVVDRYGLREKEVAKIVQLNPGETFKCDALEVTRMELTRTEIAEQQKGS